MLLRALAAPINPADINTIQGSYGSLPPLDSTALGTARPAVVPGNEGVFEVVAAGPDVARRFPGLKTGAWVLPQPQAKDGKGGEEEGGGGAPSFGTWRTHVVCPAADVFAIDKAGLSAVQAATATVNPVTAYRLLRTVIGSSGGYVPLPNESLSSAGGPAPVVLREGDGFIQNAGNSGVGRAALQLAARWGLRSISVVRSRPTEEGTRALVDELVALGGGGGLASVVTEEALLSREWTGTLAKLTRGVPLKLGLNAVGGRNGMRVARSLGRGGTLVTYGGMGRQPLAVGAGMLIFGDVRFVGFWLSRWGAAEPEEKKRAVGEVLDYMRRGQMDVGPTEEVRWDWATERDVLVAAVQRGLEGFKSGKAVFVFGET